MERCEVLLVEARQYKLNDMRIVVPTLFGYTEEARKIKRTIRITNGKGKKWDYYSFFSYARARLPEKTVKAIEKLFRECKSLSADIIWGEGRTAGSFRVRWPHICRGTILVVY